MAASSGVMVAGDGDYAENRRLGVGILPAGRQIKGGEYVLVGNDNRDIHRYISRSMGYGNLYCRKERLLKIILTYPDTMGPESEKIIIDWLQQWIDDAKHSKVSSPLRYCDDMEVEQ